MTKKKKILLASPLPPPYSGYEKVTQTILGSDLVRKFDVVHVNTSNNRDSGVRGSFDLANLLTSIRRWGELFVALFVHRPEVVNIPIARNRMGFLKYSLYILLAIFFRCRIVSKLGGENFDVFYERSSPLFQWYIRAVLKKIAIMVVEADRLQAQFAGLVEPERLRTVYLGLDMEKDFAALAGKTRPVPAEAPGKNVNVLFLGYISKAKGALDLLESIPAVVAHKDSVRFTLAGPMIRREKNIVHIDNPVDTKAAVEKILAVNDLCRHVRLPGEVTGDRKATVFRKADMFVLPSYSEGFPFVVLEAMAAGLPLITTRVGALPEILEEGRNVLFVKTSAPGELAEKIVALAENSQLRREMGAANRRLVEKKFNLNCFARQMEKIYDAV